LSADTPRGWTGGPAAFAFHPFISAVSLPSAPSATSPGRCLCRRFLLTQIFVCIVWGEEQRGTLLNFYRSGSAGSQGTDLQRPIRCPDTCRRSRFSNRRQDAGRRDNTTQAESRSQHVASSPTQAVACGTLGWLIEGGKRPVAQCFPPTAGGVQNERLVRVHSSLDEQAHR
jgi:hypothetical protein